MFNETTTVCEMSEKKRYIIPELVIEVFSSQDVLTDSGDSESEPYPWSLDW